MASHEYICPTVCAECPFRKTGLQAVRINSRSAQRIANDVRSSKPFPCHLTSTPNGLGTEPADRAEWRFCAGAYLAMSEQERAENHTLQDATGYGIHDRDFEPHGKKLCFTSLDEFLDYYA